MKDAQIQVSEIKEKEIFINSKRVKLKDGNYLSKEDTVGKGLERWRV